jgi:hypothetical protein
MSNRTARPKASEVLHQEQIQESRKQLWNKIWSYLIIAILVAVVLGSIYIQIQHHL